MAMLPPFQFKKWIEDHRHELKPPVGNKLLWQNSDFVAFVVGGPNSRTDFHVDESEEIFYQLEGDIVLRLIENDTLYDLTIREGDIFLLPPRVPHSPQRGAGTVGLVIERKRRNGEKDGFQWYCPKCSKKVYEEFLQVENIERDLPPVFERFYSDAKNSTCDHCGFRITRPQR